MIFYKFVAEDGTTEWKFNKEMFEARFSPETQNDCDFNKNCFNLVKDNVKYVKNLYFLYSMMTRSISKLELIWKSMTFYTGNKEYDTSTKSLVLKIIENLKQSPGLFQEKNLFSADEKEAMLMQVF